jgi:hypothetical protein
LSRRHGVSFALLAVSCAAQPGWIAVREATYFGYENNRAVETSEATLRSVYEFPQSSLGCHPASRCTASCTYGDVFPWFVNAGGVDLTGTHPYRNPSNGSVAGPYHGVTGIEFTGILDGHATGDAPDYVWEVVFFHEQKCYSGGLEFGFRRDAVSNAFQAYWSINSNCGLDDGHATSVCRSVRGGGAHVQESTGAVNLPYAAGVNRYRMSAQRDPKDKKLKFLVEISQPQTSLWVDPNSPGAWFRSPADPGATFPIEKLAMGSGYVTVGIQRSAAGAVKPSGENPPAVRVRSLRIDARR